MNIILEVLNKHQNKISTCMTVISLLNGGVPNVTDFIANLNHPPSLTQVVEQPKSAEDLASEYVDSEDIEKDDSEEEENSKDVIQKSTIEPDPKDNEEYDEWEEYSNFSKHESMSKVQNYKHNIGSIKNYTVESQETVSDDYLYGIGM